MVIGRLFQAFWKGNSWRLSSATTWSVSTADLRPVPPVLAKGVSGFLGGGGGLMVSISTRLLGHSQPTTECVLSGPSHNIWLAHHWGQRRNKKLVELVELVESLGHRRGLCSTKRASRVPVWFSVRNRTGEPWCVDISTSRVLANSAEE